MWAKQGTTRAERRAEWETCLFSAAKEIPPAMAAAFNPDVSTPATLVCNNYGGTVNCRNVGGVNIPASARTVDQNAGLRKRYADVCMEKKGFVRVPGKLCARADDLMSEDCGVAVP